MLTISERPVDAHHPVRGQTLVGGMRRRSRWVGRALVVALAVVVLCSAGLVLALHAHRQSIVVLARDKWWAEKITAGDLATVDVASERDLDAIPASEKGRLIGQTLTTGLPAGSVVTRADLASSAFPPGGAQLVGLRTEVGQRPAQPLRPGALVCVSPLPAALPCDADGARRGGSFRAHVADTGVPDQAGVVVVDVLVGRTFAQPALAAASRPVIITLVGP